MASTVADLTRVNACVGVRAQAVDIPPATGTQPDEPHASRRRFLTLAAVATATAPQALRAFGAEAAALAPAAAKPLPRLALTDATAEALAYAEDATKVKHAALKAGSDCASCNLYKGDRDAATGPCMLFPKNSVVANGWCGARAKKI